MSDWADELAVHWIAQWEIESFHYGREEFTAGLAEEFRRLADLERGRAEVRLGFCPHRDFGGGCFNGGTRICGEGCACLCHESSSSAGTTG